MDVINKKHTPKRGNIQKYLDIYPYEIQMIVPEQKVIKGEKDKRKRKCIYCGGSVKDGKTRSCGCLNTEVRSKTAEDRFGFVDGIYTERRVRCM